MSTLPHPRYYVYVLARSDSSPFYVGKGTGSGKKARVYDHEREARSGHRCRKCNTIRKIWRSGGQVQCYILLTTDDEAAAYAYEREVIAMYGRNTLCNRTEGGEGHRGKTSAATRKKLSRIVKRRFKSSTERARHSERVKAYLAAPENHAERQRRIDLLRAPDTLVKQRAAMKAYLNSPEGKAQRSKQLHAPDVEAKRIAGMKAYLNSPEGKAQRAATTREVQSRPEIRAKHSETMKAWWAARKAAERDAKAARAPQIAPPPPPGAPAPPETGAEA